jgi:hypothetical protein
MQPWGKRQEVDIAPSESISAQRRARSFIEALCEILDVAILREAQDVSLVASGTLERSVVSRAGCG